MKKIPQNFDITIFLRYKPIVEFLKSESKKLTVCEIGSGNFGIGPYLKRDFFGVDITFSDNKSKYLIPIKRTAENLPKTWTSKFDAVVSIDMLEHVPPSKRRSVVFEMARVTKNYAFVSFPSGKVSRLTDLVLRKYYKKTHGDELGFLLEHEKYPLPCVKNVILDFKKQTELRGKKIKKINVSNNTSCLLHLFLLLLGFSENKYFTRVFRFSYYIRRALSFINFVPYRKLIFFELEK